MKYLIWPVPGAFAPPDGPTREKFLTTTDIPIGPDGRIAPALGESIDIEGNGPTAAGVAVPAVGGTVPVGIPETVADAETVADGGATVPGPAAGGADVHPAKTQTSPVTAIR